MNATPNLPEPTYRFQKLLVSIQGTKELIKSMMVLTKKLLML